MSKDVIIESQIEGLNEYGEGFFTYHDHIIKLGRTVPGDVVRVQLPELAKRYVRGQALELIRGSEDRVAPGLCPHFSTEASPFSLGCGGCQWLHIAYARQLQAKAGIVGSLLRRHSGLKLQVQPVLGMQNPSAYRNKMSLINVGGRPAFKKEYSEEPVYPVTCLQETPEIQTVWAKLRDLAIPEAVLQVHLRSAGGQVGVLLFVRRYGPEVESLARTILATDQSIRGVGAASYRDYRVLAGLDDLEQELGGVRYGIPLNGFFQTNYAQALVLRTVALAQLGLRANDKLLDIFCGSGFFSLSAASQVDSVLGIENNRDSIAGAVANARRNKVSNARFVSSDATKALRDLKTGSYNLALLDPPRAGCGPLLIAELIRLRPQRIVYVSCSPESLARDLAILAKSDYKVIHCQPVDMFPHTFHIETVVTLIKNN